MHPSPEHPSTALASTARAARARRPAAGHSPSPAKEVERLRKRVRQQEISLAVLTEALTALRSGGQALREENRELRHQLDVARRSGAAAA